MSRIVAWRGRERLDCKIGQEFEVSSEVEKMKVRNLTVLVR